MSQLSGVDTNQPYPRLGAIYDLITGDEDARACLDIPDSACKHQPRNFFAYLFANALTKVADELSSARLILPWLMGALGAPAVFVGFLVPVREAGVLLPQLAVAAYIRRLERRKIVWLTGALLSGLMLLILIFVANTMRGVVAGWAILTAMVVFSLARGLCSVAAKDVLGKTVSRTRRGTLMGYATGISGIATLAIGLYLGIRNFAELPVLIAFLAGAAVLWVVAVLLFAQIVEAPGATEGGSNALAVALEGITLVVHDKPFRDFLIARALLLSVALVIPFYVLLFQQRSGDTASLGLLIIASGLASSVSAPVWGRLSDTSSRLVMTIASLGAGILGVGTWLVADQLGGSLWIPATLFFLIALFHAGARLGRKVYLVDMATEKNRATYVAVSNTLIGLCMLVAGAFGIIGDLFGADAIIGILGAISCFTALFTLTIRDVSTHAEQN